MTQVLCDYLRVWELLRSVTLVPLQPDRFVWEWSADGSYSVSSTYRAFFAGSTLLLGAKKLWRVKAPPRVKLFFWLTLHRRLWTAVRRKRHGLQDSDECALCNQEPETGVTGGHLFLGCVFARQVWFATLRPLQLSSLMLAAEDDDVGVWWLRQRRRVDSASRPLFDSLLLLVAWSLCKERNCRVFRRPHSTVQDVARAAFKEGEDWAMAGFAPMSVLASLWSQNGDVMEHNSRIQ
ncbi:uncharacterized protein [Miscanthus floridulus]|uniref:uncharacterized protein n=1 Tax=Miscanthus floridulus TaxID=154761 RepID=UPI0034598A9C